MKGATYSSTYIQLLKRMYNLPNQRITYKQISLDGINTNQNFKIFFLLRRRWIEVPWERGKAPTADDCFIVMEMQSQCAPQGSNRYGSCRRRLCTPIHSKMHILNAFIA